MRNFESRFKTELERMIAMEHDDYTEIKYSDEITVQVWSHDNGVGSFEVYAIVPHDSVPEGIVGRDSQSQLPEEVPNSTEFYQEIESYIEDVTGKSYPNLALYLLEVVDDGSWSRDASVYCTHEMVA